MANQIHLPEDDYPTVKHVEDTRLNLSAGPCQHGANPDGLYGHGHATRLICTRCMRWTCNQSECLADHANCTA